MDFANSPVAARVVEQVRDFLVDRIEPAEARYESELVGGADWTAWRQPPTMERSSTSTRVP